MYSDFCQSYKRSFGGDSDHSEVVEMEIGYYVIVYVCDIFIRANSFTNIVTIIIHKHKTW